MSNIGEMFFGPGGNALTKLEGVGGLVSLLVRIAFIVAGVSLLLFFILGGVGMITGAGSDDPEKLEKSKKTATLALIGFLVVFASYWVVQLIELITGIPILK